MIHKAPNGSFYSLPSTAYPYQREIAEHAWNVYGHVLQENMSYSWNDFADEICKVYDVVENVHNAEVVAVLRQLHRLEFLYE